jgi:hypothetical protein
MNSTNKGSLTSVWAHQANRRLWQENGTYGLADAYPGVEVYAYAGRVRPTSDLRPVVELLAAVEKLPVG